MKCSKYKYDGKLTVAGVLLVLCMALVAGEGEEKEAIEYEKIQRFVLSSRLAQAGRTVKGGGKAVHMGANLVRLVEGELKWIVQDANGFVLDVEVRGIKVDFLDPQPKERAEIIETKPFAARVRMSKREKVPLSIRITEGRIDDEPLELTEQYKIVYLILDLMCATAVNKEFVVSEDGWGANLKIKYAEKVNIDRYGERPVRAVKSSSSPSEFIVFPDMSYEKVKGTQLFRFTHGSLTIHLFSRLLDDETGFAVRGVNLEATTTGEMKEKDYMEMIRALNMPHQFESYHLHELAITDVK